MNTPPSGQNKQLIRILFTGKTCDDNVNECETNPCLNGGMCMDTEGSFVCGCPTGKRSLSQNTPFILQTESTRQKIRLWLYVTDCNLLRKILLERGDHFVDQLYKLTDPFCFHEKFWCVMQKKYPSWFSRQTTLTLRTLV